MQPASGEVVPLPLSRLKGRHMRLLTQVKRRIARSGNNGFSRRWRIPTPPWKSRYERSGLRCGLAARALCAGLPRLRRERDDGISFRRPNPLRAGCAMSVNYLQHYANRFHHPREDVAFERMVGRYHRQTESRSRDSTEHRVIDVAGTDLLMHHGSHPRRHDRAARQDEAAAATYLLYYRHHLPRGKRNSAARSGVLTPEDWAAVAAAVPVGPIRCSATTSRALS